MINLRNITFTKQKLQRYTIFTAIIIAVMWFSNYIITETIETIAKNEGKKLPIYCVNTEGDKKIAISFDAGWGNDDTQQILDILDEYNVKATFFLVGGWVESYPDDVKHIYERGHDIGNHSENHKHMTQLNKEQMKLELMGPHEKVEKLLNGYKMNLFRAPYGDYDERVVDAARECDYYTIQWDVERIHIKVKRLVLGLYSFIGFKYEMK